MHRGAFIKNSGHLCVLVIHTGTDTKLIMNLGTYKMKRSVLEQNINKVLLVNVIALIILSLISALVNYPFNLAHMEKHQYVYEDPKGKESAVEYSFKAFWSFYLILNALIPLELVVCLEIGKFISTFYMMDDI